jgi:CHAT domain-containing protein
VTATVTDLARLSARVGKHKEAARLFDRPPRRTPAPRRRLPGAFPGLHGNLDKFDYFNLTRARWNVEMVLSLGLAHREDATVAALSSTWLLNGKAADQESLASSMLLARRSNNPDIAKRVGSLLALRQRLARLTLTAPVPGDEKYIYEQLDELARQEQELDKQLRQAGSKAALPAWVELSDVRKVLPADAILIDLHRLHVWLVPFEALTLKGGKYAIEKYQISYLTSGRDVLPSPAARMKATAPLVLADPDFDLEPSKAQARARRLLGKLDVESTRSLSGDFGRRRAPRLKGTAAEARAITPSVKAYAGMPPRVYLRSEALEAVFKAARNPRVVVLSTHGFFLPNQEVPYHTGDNPVKKWENPLLRFGLLLAGCNNAARASQGDDGILTGLEVLEADLRSCELVVLSACDTGVGEVHIGEGVSGLRQAFQLAGAQAVVATLWQVPDKASARLMSLFFKNLAKKMSKAEALRAAKLKLIEERRDDFAAAHPFFWAAFTFTGQ